MIFGSLSWRQTWPNRDNLLDEWSVEFNIWTKTDHFVFQWPTASLVMAECTCVSLIFISFSVVPSLVCADLKYLNWATSSALFHASIMLVGGLGLMLLTRSFAFVGAGFHTESMGAVFFGLSLSCCSSSLPLKSISSANCKLQAASFTHSSQVEISLFKISAKRPEIGELCNTAHLRRTHCYVVWCHE